MSDRRAERNAKNLREAREIADRLAASLPERIQIAALTLKSKLPFKAVSVRELLLHRMASLSVAAVDLFEQDRVIPAAVVTRAIVETLAVLFTFYERVERFLKDKDKNIDAFDGELMRYLLGSRNNPEMPTPTNILTHIARVEVTIPGFSSVYESLCECAHPNWAGTFGAFGEIDRKRFELKLRPVKRSAAYGTGVAALAGCLGLFEHYYNNSADLMYRLNDYFDKCEA